MYGFSSFLLVVFVYDAYWENRRGYVVVNFKKQMELGLMGVYTEIGVLEH